MGLPVSSEFSINSDKALDLIMKAYPRGQVKADNQDSVFLTKYDSGLSDNNSQQEMAIISELQSLSLLDKIVKEVADNPKPKDRKVFNGICGKDGDNKTLSLKDLELFEESKSASENDKISKVFSDAIKSAAKEFDFNPYLVTQVITKTCNEFDVDPNLVCAVIQRESQFDPASKSHRGARGFMQLAPDTAKWLGVIPGSIVQNLKAGIGYLAGFIKKYDGNLKLALAAYNAGPGNVSKYDGIPPFEETRNYIQDILSAYWAV